MRAMSLGNDDEQYLELIEKYGFYVQHVFLDLGDGNPPYSFTDGLSYARDDKYPEIVLAGFTEQLMQDLIMNAVEHMKSGDLILTGPKFFDKIVQNFDVAFVPINPDTSTSPTTHTNERDVYLMVVPDPKGLFPWEDGCHPGYMKQVNGFDCIAFPNRDTPTTGYRH